MMTVEPISSTELTTRTGRPGVLYKLNDESGRQYLWGGTANRFVEQAREEKQHQTAAISGTATITAAQLALGVLVFSGGAGTQTLPTAALLAAEINAVAGTVIDFHVINVAGSGTCTIAASTGIVAGPAVITGGATLTVANSATQGVGVFRIVFTSATAAVLFRIG